MKQTWKRGAELFPGNGGLKAKLEAELKPER